MCTQKPARATIETHPLNDHVDSPSAASRALGDPPRVLSQAALLRLRFGNAVTQFGAFFFFFGLAFARIFVPAADLGGGLSDDVARIQAELTDAESTNYAEGSDPGTPIWRIHYRYSVDGLPYEGSSYVTASAKPTTGGRIQIDYERTAPAESVAVGGRRKPFGPSVLFVLLFPLVGGGLIFFMWRRAGRRIDLLRNGILTDALIKGREATNMVVNNRPVYRLDLEFVDEDGVAHSASTRTHETERLEHEVEPLLYAPENPDCLQLLDAMPAVTRDHEGRIQIRGGTPLVVLLLIPGLGVLGHGLWWLANEFG